MRRRRTAIVDIGSNSVRLVVYDGAARLPAVLFNEKMMAGLGRGLGDGGAIADAAIDRALMALARFARLCEMIAPDETIAVATAAVRDAANGAIIVEGARSLGFDVTTLSGEEEAAAAASGVLSAFPQADGLVGDLGGGSLELVRVAEGRVHRGLSLPLGVLRLADGADMAGHLAGALDRAPWLREGRGHPFYLVGGSWRAVARLSMYLRGHGLPILHAYRMAPDEVPALVAAIEAMDKAALKQVPDLSAARAQTLLDAAQLLAAVVERIAPSCLVVSAFGLREGLLYDRLDAAERAEDPLIVAAREDASRHGRFPEHGDLIDAWIAPLFPDDAADAARLRLCAALLADVGWRANPDFRAERGREAALHGNWVGIDARGRAIVAQALHAASGGGADAFPDYLQFAEPAALMRASAWGLAIRLAQRLGAGCPDPLRAATLRVEDGRLRLALGDGDRMLYSDIVERRLKRLGAALALDTEIVIRSENR